MHITIAVTRKPDKLTIIEWRFWLDNDGTLVLTSYREGRRKPNGRIYRYDIKWDTMFFRDGIGIRPENIPIPPDVAQQAKDDLIAMISVKHWKER